MEFGEGRRESDSRLTAGCLIKLPHNAVTCQVLLLISMICGDLAVVDGAVWR